MREMYIEPRIVGTIAAGLLLMAALSYGLTYAALCGIGRWLEGQDG